MQLPRRSWNDLAAAHGDCGHIPNALAALADTSESVRQAARWKIENHVVLQGDLYEGAPWVARELVEMLRQSDLPDRSLVLDLLMEFALGSNVGDSFVTSRGQISVDHATKQVIADGLGLFQAELVGSDPRAASLARQVIEEIEEWREDRTLLS